MMKGPTVHPALKADLKDTRDQNALRAVPAPRSNGRFQSTQSPPMLFTREGHAAYLGDSFRGSAAFLVCGGPSLVTHDLSQLERRGMLTMALNNAATVIRPRLWCSVDDPGHFSDVIWRDPGITKFVPMSHFEKGFLVRNDEERLIQSGEKVGDLPSVFGFRRNESFVAEQWLHEDTFNWGNRGDRVDAHGNKGSRSVMYPALRLLYYLGVRRVYLLGCDFKMEQGKQNYAFEQARSRSSVNGNNHSYQVLNNRLGHLKPHFEAAGFSVFNCTPESGLTVFPYRDYEAAIEEALSPMPQRIITRGMYDGADAIKSPTPKAGEPAGKSPAGPPAAGIGNGRVAGDVNTAPAEGMLMPDEVTLVTLVDAERVPAFRRAWFDWKQRFEALRGAPAIVIHDSRMRIRSAGLGFLETDPRVRLVPCDLGLTPAAHEAALIEVPREHVGTPWYLRLKPGASADGPAEPLNLGPSWRRAALHVDRGGAVPANVAVTRELDAWWAGGRKNSRRLPARRALTQASGGESGGAMLVHTGWLRKVMGDFPMNASGVTDDGVLRYCAERRHEPIARLNARPATTTPRRVEPTKPLAGSRPREAGFKAPPAAGNGKPSNEYRRLKRRDFKEYSLGHQKMYTVPIELLKNVKAKYRILDVGFGIGFGLERMLEAGIVEGYVGVEPVADSFAYVREKFGSLQNVRLLNDDWLTVPETNLEPADYVFCIEVVEHLPQQVVGPFLGKLARFTKRTLFLSTPDCERSSHGTRTDLQWTAALAAAGLKAVAISSQWTTLYCCQQA